MKKNLDPRQLHVGKTNEEKAAYQKFLREYQDLDKTVEDKGNFSKTDSSTFQNEDATEPPHIDSKSLLLKIKDGDFLNNPWFVAIVGGFIGCVVLLYVIQISISQGTLSSRVDSMQKDIDNMKSNDNNITDQFNQLQLKLSVALEGAQKDIEFIKEILHLH